MSSDPLDEAWGWRRDPCGVIAIERACDKEPRLREVMKWYDEQDRYVRCDLMVCSIPSTARDLQVFGIFVVDVDALARRKPRPIEQDFLVRSTRGASPTVYYSGVPRDHPLAASGFWQDMSALCLRVGRNGDYGCRETKPGRWETPDHWLPLDAPLFDSQPGIRAAIDKAVAMARSIIELRLMGAMPPPERPWKARRP